MHPDRPKVANVDEYLALLPPAAQQRLQQIRQLIKAEAPEANEVISYAIPAYKLPGKGHAFIFLAGYAKHISIYPVPHTPDPRLAKDMAPQVAGKGTLRFNLDQPLPVELVTRIITALHSQAVDGT